MWHTLLNEPLQSTNFLYLIPTPSILIVKNEILFRKFQIIFFVFPNYFFFFNKGD